MNKGKIIESGKYNVYDTTGYEIIPVDKGQEVIFRHENQDKFTSEFTRVQYKKFTFSDDSLYRDCMSLSDSSLKIFMSMCQYVQFVSCYVQNINRSYVDNEQLQKINNKSASTIQRGIKELITKGFIAKTKDINGIQCYVINPYYIKRNSSKTKDYYLASSVALFMSK